jgi:DNA mismatch repair protein MutL
MADIIQLLPDNIANQIAAGEVIQRPASVVKELVENAVDAKATEIRIIFKEAGKTLIQIIDNGIGMSPTDARLSFERHATSKIRTSEDLFSIKTKGFRGEALASIAAIAHVEMHTKREEDELGTRILIHGSKIEKQEALAMTTGTNFSVKNLFYNVPARRKFLKSDPVELRHLIEEIHRIALAHPEITFYVHHNGQEVYHLPSGTLKQRIVGIFGKQYNDKLLTIGEESDSLKIDGFVLKADAAKKNAGEQYLFVNNRFIKSHYLNHAVKAAFDQLLQPDYLPGFFIFLSLDPSTIDINVHPTKTEIKFNEDRLIYNFLKVCVKHALGKYLVAPTLDFEVNTNYYNSTPETLKVVSDRARYDSAASKLEKENIQAWSTIFENIQPNERIVAPEQLTLESDATTQFNTNQSYPSREPYQLHNSYIISHVKTGYLLIDQQYAHERVLYEEILSSIHSINRPVQRELFAQTIEFDAATAGLLVSLLPKLNGLGFEIGEFGKNTFVIHGLPAGLDSSANSVELLKSVLNTYNENLELQLGIDINVARSYASCACIKRGKTLSVHEMKKLIDELFACQTPFVSPGGHKTFVQYDLEDIKKLFK